MKFVDFHTHLDLYKNQNELFEQLSSFYGTIVTASIDLDSYKKNCWIVQKAKALGFEANIIATLGIYPEKVLLEKEKLCEYEKFLKESHIIGEIGMDFCWYKEASPVAQEEVLRFFLEHCNQEKKYCVIHTKDAEEKICRILEEYPFAKPIIHWYDGPEEIYKEFVGRNYMQTFGCETIRSKHIQKLLGQTPLNLILAETDNPDSEKWLGGTDSSIFLIERIYKDIAEVLGLKIEKIVKTINENSAKILKEF